MAYCDFLPLDLTMLPHSVLLCTTMSLHAIQKQALAHIRVNDRGVTPIESQWETRTPADAVTRHTANPLRGCGAGTLGVKLGTIIVGV